MFGAQASAKQNCQARKEKKVSDSKYVQVQLMLSKARIKFIKSLQIKKYRIQEQSFLVQGEKAVREVLNSKYQVQFLVATSSFLQANPVPRHVDIVEASTSQLEEISSFQTNSTALAVVSMQPPPQFPLQHDKFYLALDDISDPGNLGTIIRIADWFGITELIASSHTADLYNPKVINATMGSFLRVSIMYGDLTSILSGYRAPIYGAFLTGVPLNDMHFDKGGVLVIGNESRGISEELSALVTERITIPKYGGAESLNAAVATGILCYHIRSSVN